MTAIVAAAVNGKVCIGGDAAAVSNSGDIFTVKGQKVFIKAGIAFGYAGSFRLGQLVQYSMEVPLPLPNPSEDMTFDNEMDYIVNKFIPELQRCLDEGSAGKINSEVKELVDDSLMIIGFNGKIFQICNNYAVIENASGYLAVGVGEPYALGSLFTSDRPDISIENRVQWALEAATHLHGGVRPPYTIITI